MKLNQFGGGLFEFHSNVGGVCCFENRVAKMGGGSTFFIKYGLIIEYICNFFAFLGWFHKIFFSKFSPRPKGAKLVHPPPLDVFDSFP